MAGLVAKLFFRRRTTAVGPIGLQFSYEKLHLIQMSYAGDEPQLLAAASLSYPVDRAGLLEHPAQLKALLGKALRRQGFVGRRVVSCLSHTDVKLLSVNYDKIDPAHEPQKVLRLALDRVGGEAGDWVVDYLPIRGPDDQMAEQTSLVAVSARDRVDAYLDLLGRAGLEVAALDVGPSAIRRLLVQMGEAAGHEQVLVINYGRRESYLTVVAGRRLVLDRMVPLGEDHIIDRLARTLDMPGDQARKMLYQYGLGHAEATPEANEVAQTIEDIVKPLFLELANEVRKAVTYAASQTRGAALDHVYLLGGIARWPGAEGLVSQTLGLTARVLNVLEGFHGTPAEPDLQGLEPVAGLAVACGCALRKDQPDG